MVLLLLLLLVARAIRKNDLESENKGLFSAAFGTGIKVNPGYRLPGDNHIPEKMKIRPFQRSALLCFALLCFALLLLLKDIQYTYNKT